MGFAGVKEFFQPESAQEAVNWLAQHRERALLLGSQSPSKAYE